MAVQRRHALDLRNAASCQFRGLSNTHSGIAQRDNMTVVGKVPMSVVWACSIRYGIGQSGCGKRLPGEGIDLLFGQA
ncbi:hypothetical protein [Sphingomonas sp. Leaf62]|uniref:hypothetical protein n=1 Tax=Sphingomonas sp. Leaf62 TaxID=1736228 RepID=UPI0006F7807E|nr:hypothetical protein [Sphingomonas sp. Leaf62]KQN73030.1 hypothetical protein ASE91_18475 [Sphingomonas sp. Leaf62]